MKRILSLVLLMSFILPGSVILRTAGETITQDSGESSSSLTVDYNAGVTYTVTIPASVTFSDTEKEVERALQVSNVVLNAGSVLNVNLTSLNQFKMMCGEGYIEYGLKINHNEAPEGNNYTVLTVPAGENTGWAILNFSTDLQKEHALYAGNYTDTLTFTVVIN